MKRQQTQLTIAIYSRKSKFVEGSESIENQLQICKEYAIKQYGKTIEILEYEDEGYSGENIKRPKFQRLIKDVEKHKFDILICYRLDRISRNVADFSSILELLQENKIEFISIREQFDTTTPMGRAMIYIASVFAQLERETIAERIKDNLLELAKEGKWLGGKEPLGYKKKGIGSQCFLEIDKSTSYIVEKMFETYLEYDSIAQVHKMLINEGIKTRNNTHFTANSVRRILINPIYCVADKNFYEYAKYKNIKIFNSEEEYRNNKEFGVMSYNKQEETGRTVRWRDESEWIVSIGKHKAIISSEIWVEVQKRIIKNANKAPRKGTSQDALLGGMLRCRHCGHGFRIIANYRNGERRQHYYKCRGKSSGLGIICSVKNINGYEADKMVIEYIKRLGTNKKLLRELFEVDKESLNNNSVTDQIQNLNKDILDKTNSIDKLTEKLIEAENSVASKYIVEKIEKLDKEMKDIRNKINELEDNMDENNIKEINFKIIEDEVDYLVANLDYLNLEQKKKIVRDIFKMFWWDGENLKGVPNI